jgi:hypothetical protein
MTDPTPDLPEPIQPLIGTPAAREACIQAVIDALQDNADRLRELHHQHVRLDANARHLIAELAVDAITSISRDA